MDLGSTWRGGQGQAFLLMQGLRALGHQADLVAVAGSAIAEKASAAGIRVYPVGRRTARLGAAIALGRLSSRYGLVHAHDAHGLTAAWLAGSHRRSRLVVARRLAYPLSRSALGLARYRDAARIIAVSRFVGESVVASGVPPDRVCVVHDGVEIPPTPLEAERTAARARWAAGSRGPVIGCVGYLLPEKGQELLIRAVPAILGRHPGCAVILAGNGPTRTRLERLAVELGIASSVRFAGHVVNVAEVYHALDLFCFPSLAEPLGSSLLAAMAHSIPAVSVARGAVPEVIEDGRNGLLASSPDPSLIAAAVLRLLDDPAFAKRLGEEGRKTIESRFSAGRMVESTLEIYRGL